MLDPEYKPSQFSRKDYHKLYEMATQGNGLRSRLNAAKYRDKRIQRSLRDSEIKVFYCPYKDLPKHINSTLSALDILKWRLTINK